MLRQVGWKKASDAYRTDSSPQVSGLNVESTAVLVGVDGQIFWLGNNFTLDDKEMIVKKVSLILTLVLVCGALVLSSGCAGAGAAGEQVFSD